VFLFLPQLPQARCAPAYSSVGRKYKPGRPDSKPPVGQKLGEAGISQRQPEKEDPALAAPLEQPIVRLILRLFAYFIALFWCGTLICSSTTYTESRARMPAPAKKRNDDDTTIGWITVTYRSVLLAVMALLFVVAVVLYFAFPKTSHDLMSSLTDSLSSLTSKVGGSAPPPGHGPKPAGNLKTSFTNLDGSVKVKKKNSNTWVTADYNLPLEKGDVIQTGAEGMAKIVFADLTNYTVKPDSLIVIEQNSSNAEQQTNVAVQVTTGTVDLSTATYSQGSKSQVIAA